MEPVSEEPLEPLETVAEARRLLALGRPFAAHEVMEARWKAGPDDERALWQGLAQVCVGLTHAARGNAVGAVRLFGRGADNLQAYLNSQEALSSQKALNSQKPPDGQAPLTSRESRRPDYGLDLPFIIAWARRQRGDVSDNSDGLI